MATRLPPVPAPTGAEFLTVENILARFQMSRASLYRAVSRGEFPAPVKLGRSTRWRVSDVDAWVASLTPKSAA